MGENICQGPSRHFLASSDLTKSKKEFIFDKKNMFGSALYWVSITQICRIKNSDILRAGRIEAAHTKAARLGGIGQEWTPTDQFAQSTMVSRTL